jgi:hypothetical protein
VVPTALSADLQLLARESAHILAIAADLVHVQAASTGWVPVSELRSQLAFTASPNWGYQLRLGLIELDPVDVGIIRDAMGDTNA